MSLDKVREYLKAEPFNSVYYDGEYKKPCEAPPLHAGSSCCWPREREQMCPGADFAGVCLIAVQAGRRHV